MSRNAIIEVTDGRYVVADSARTDLRPPPVDSSIANQPGRIAAGDGMAIIECFTQTGLVKVMYTVAGSPPDFDDEPDIGEWDTMSDPVVIPMVGLPVVRTVELGPPLRGRGNFPTEDDETGLTWGMRIHTRKVGFDDEPSYRIPGPLEEHFVDIWFISTT